MLEQFKNISRRGRQALLAALVTLIAAITGCDKKPEWRGVGTDSRGGNRTASTDAAPGEPANG